MYNYISCGVKNTFVVEFIYLNGLICQQES